MDTSSIALIQEFINNLRSIMECFSVNVSSNNKYLSSSSTDTVNIEELEKQMKEFKEELLKNNIKTSEDIGGENCVTSNPTARKTSHSSHTKKCDANENCSLLEERNTLTRENKNLKEEADRLRNENYMIKKQLEEEALSRQRLQREFSEFAKLLESNRKSGLSETQNNNKDELTETRIKTKLSESQNNYKSEVLETQSNTSISETQNNTVERFYYEKVNGSQVNTHKTQTDNEHKEREKLRFRNIDLERQLNEAKKTVRSHEKRLLAYSQLRNNHPSANLTYNLKPQSYPKASSAPTSPSDKEINDTIQQSLFRKHYDTNVNEFHNLNVKYDSRFQRKFSSCDSISSDYTVSTSCSSQGFDWRYTDMEVLARKSRSSEPSIYSDYKSS